MEQTDLEKLDEKLTEMVDEIRELILTAKCGCGCNQPAINTPEMNLKNKESNNTSETNGPKQE